jgi:hypothetical protein
VAEPIISRPSLEIPIFDLEEHHCRYVTGKGDLGLATFCGHQIAYGTSWCPFHCSVVFNPTPPTSSEKRAEAKTKTFEQFSRAA